MKPLDREWRPVVTDRIPEGLYEVSEYGDIWSIRNKQLMKPRKDKDGYLFLFLSVNGKDVYTRVGRLVGLMFLDPPPKDMVKPTIDHIDGNRRNDHISNLRWMAHGKNSGQRHHKGDGAENPNAKLTEEQVIEIWNLIKTTNLSNKEIAKMYGVEYSTINSIRTGKSWFVFSTSIGALRV